MANDEYVTKDVFQQFERRIDQHNERQDGRLKSIDAKLEQIGGLTAEIGRVATNTERILKQLESHDTRIGDLEKRDTGISKLETINSQIDTLKDAQGEQNERLKALESRDGEKWRKLIGYVITAVIGCVIGFIFTRLGMG